MAKKVETKKKEAQWRLLPYGIAVLKERRIIINTHGVS